MGTGHLHFRHKVEVIKLSQPVRVGSDSAWAAIADSPQMGVAVKSDGSVWRFRNILETDANRNRTSSHFAAEPQRWLAGPHRRAVSASVGSARSIAVVFDDGTLWVGGDLFRGELFQNPELFIKARRELVRLDARTDRRTAKVFGWNRLAAITTRGQLCRWSPRFLAMGDAVVEEDVPSHYSDWIAIGVDRYQRFFALADDGTLARWNNKRAYPGLLAPSRIKAVEIARLSR